MSVMTDHEAEEYIRKGGEFGAFVANLTNRCIEAESRAESLQTVCSIQESEIESLRKALSNADRRAEDALRDVGIMNDALTRAGAVIQEAHAQRMSIVPKRGVQKLTGSPMRDDTPMPRVVRAGPDMSR